MKKYFLLLAGVVALCAQTYAQASVEAEESTQGMWLPLNVADLKYEDMQYQGLELPAEQLYDEEKPSLEDAIVQLNGGQCTAEMISPQGLMLTNYHCSIDAIAGLSTVENDYTTEGFWSMKKEEELPVPGFTATFLVRSEDVTEQILGEDRNNFQGAEQRMEALAQKVSQETGLDATVEAMFHGAEFYLFVYETYTDVRLVGTPPGSIGEYGGDTDNWMWPRHTGDFTLFRVYAGADNKPADYAPENKPYQPKHYLPISLEGVTENDFAMIMGYPGSTERYLTSFAIKQKLDQTNGDQIKLLEQKLRIVENKMKMDEEARIILTPEENSLDNYYKYLIGQTTMLKRYDVVGEKEEDEAAFQLWVESDPEREKAYGSILSDIEELIGAGVKEDKFFNYLNLGTAASSAIEFSFPFAVNMRMGYQRESPEMVDAAKSNIELTVDEHFEGFFPDMDKEIFYQAFLTFYKDIPEDLRPPIYDEILEDKASKARKGKTFEDKVRRWTDYAYNTSLVTDKTRTQNFLNNPTEERLEADPLVSFLAKVYDFYIEKVGMKQYMSGIELDQLRRVYLQGLREMHAETPFYPDANSTMRVAFGKVKPYRAKDAVIYDYYSTLEGVIAKEDSTNDEFIVPTKLKQLWEDKDYGRYEVNGTVPVCFLSTCESTGGNSGSPIMNARGELIGCAFDGNWESMSGDIYVFPQFERSIAVDIRYILFVVEKLGGAKHIIDELTIKE